ncbi:hypothetical protein FB446DRAFT_794352 [Lentinula raphanica]|nr:hypothetical protein FB446DRAFT_794352 [Lentinula raphanica]
MSAWDSPLRTMPSDVENINNRVLLMKKDGLYGHTVQAFFLGTACDNARLVNVPVDVNISTWKSIDDLDMKMYLWTSAGPGIRSCGANWFYIDRFPVDATTALSNPFTIIFEPRMTKSAWNILLVKKTVPFENQWFPGMRGNILVFKHDLDGIIDMQFWDWRLVKVIVEWLVVNRYVHEDRTLPGLFSKQLPTVIPPDLFQPTQLSTTVPLAPVQRTQVFWATHELRWAVFSSMGVATLFNFASCSWETRKWVQYFYRGRLTSVLSDFFPQNRCLELVDVIDTFEGRIAGSIAYRIVDPMSTFVPRNLNIVVPSGCRLGLQRVLIKEWNCTLGIDGRNAGRKIWRPWSNGTTQLSTEKGFKITITESVDDYMLPLMLAGYSTAECVLVGRQTFTILYPSLVEEGIVLKMSNYGSDMPDDYMDVLASRFDTYESTELLPVPCAEACPRLWRRSLGQRWCVTYRWSGRRGLPKESDLAWGSFEWKIGHDCRNSLCRWKNTVPLDLSRT